MKDTADKNSVNAQVVDGALIVSSLAADLPLLVRIDMNLSAAVSVSVKDEKDAVRLVITHDGGEDINLGSFKHKADALQAMQIITDAMFFKPCPVKCSVKAGGFYSWVKRLLKIIGIGFAVVAVLFILATFFARNKVTNDVVGSAVNNPPAQTGQPVPMDQLLGNKQ